MKTLLVTGISGFLGWHIAHYKQDDWNIVGLYNNNQAAISGIETIKCDLNADKTDLEAILIKTKATAVLHLAALSKPNDCEQSPETSRAINVEATANLARLCRKHSIHFVFASTDLVFDGKHAPYDENSATSPVNVYGRHKAEAEKQVVELNAEAAIARLPLMYSLNCPIPTFAQEWIKHLNEGKQLQAFTDEHRTAASGESVASGLFLLLEHRASGIWHLGGKERISRYEFARTLAKALQLPVENVIESQQKIIAHLTHFAARPSDVSLSSEKAFALGYKPQSTQAYFAKTFE